MTYYAKRYMALGIALLGVAALALWADGRAVEQSEERYMDIESYVRDHISELSPVKEELGGTFYVTSIQARDGAGRVEYEDGHNAHSADFTYVVHRDGRPEVTAFTVR